MASAISSLDRPWATRATTSRSRLVRLSIPAAATASGGRATNSLIRRRVTAGDSSASPPTTTRSAWSSSAGWVSFSRNPLAPARSARKMYSSSPKLVRITTRTLSRRSSATICLVASRPSSTGIWMSMSAMSGRCSAASATACCPSAASATTSMSSSASSSDLMPLRISAWSSASRILITTAPASRQRPSRQSPSRQRPRGQFGPHPEAAVVLRSGLELAAEGGHPLAHADEAETGTRRPGAVPVASASQPGSAAVVVNLDGESLRSVVQVHRRAGLAGVAADVGERFLHDPVGGLVCLGRKRPHRPGHGHRHGEAGRPGARHQAVKLAEAAAVAVLLAQHAERGAQFPDGVRARLLDRQQRGRDVLPALAGQVHRHPRLDLDHRDAVRQGIVQLAGDAQALLHGPAPGGLVLGPHRLFRALLDLADVQLPHAERHAHDGRRDEPPGGVEPLPAPICAHSPSLRVVPASASAQRRYCRLLPARYPRARPHPR